MMNLIEDIVKLKENGLTLQEIAQRMNMSLGKVQYRWNKYRQQQTPSNHEISSQPVLKKEKWSMPFEYEEANVHLMPRTPDSLYAYWSFSESTKQMAEHHFRTKWEELPSILKIYDVTDIDFFGHNAHRTFEVELPSMTNNWFVHSLEPGRTYIADIGTRTFDGSFFTLLRSNPVETSPSLYNSFHDEKIDRWKHQSVEQPEWLENFSTYSYYQKIR